MSLHPAFRAYLDELNPLVDQAAAFGFVPTPESARAALAGLNQFAAAPIEVADVSDREIDGVPVRVYVPTPGVPSDVVYFIHGGGHMAGDLDVYDFQCRRVAAAQFRMVVSRVCGLGARFVLGSYRLARRPRSPRTNRCLRGTHVGNGPARFRCALVCPRVSPRGFQCLRSGNTMGGADTSVVLKNRFTFQIVPQP